MLVSISTLWVLVVALLLDAVIGDPDWLWGRVSHPVVWFGRLIDWLDELLNDASRSEIYRRVAGVVAIAIVVACAAAVGCLVARAVHPLPFGWLLEALVASAFLAQRSLYEHVARVRIAFADEGLSGARRAVGAIVGRDPEALDDAGVCRAAIETTAENFSDGVVAPAFWFALLGLPGLMAYKAINTADSMIGHRTAQHQAFGWASARLDDAVNLVPARLAGVLFAIVSPLVGGSIGESLSVMWRDAGLHRSPNAGWPESAAAAALGVALAGLRVYAEGIVADPYVNADGRKNATPQDIGYALRLLVAACGLEIVVYVALALVV
jgi:adenosylcobinamide-phosphate synthase